MLSTTNLGVIAFLILVSVWLFVRPREIGDGLFLAVAGVIYVAVLFATFWKLGEDQTGRLIGSLLAETVGLVLVAFSKRPKRQP